MSGRSIPQLACQGVLGLFLAIPALLFTILQAKEGKGAVLKMNLVKAGGPSPRIKDR